MLGALTGVPDFEVRVYARDDSVVVAVSGELDMGTVEEPRARVLEHLASAPVVLDLRDVTFMDSSALQLLDDLMRAPGTLTFRLPESDRGCQALRLTGMLTTLPLEPG